MNAYARQIYDFEQFDDPAPAAVDPAKPQPILITKAASGAPRAVKLTPWHIVFMEKFANLVNLGRDWDGRGSAAVRGDALVFAYSMLQSSMAPGTTPPAIVPLGHGGISLNWSNAAADIEVEVVGPNDVVIYYLDHATGEEREWPSATEFSELSSLLRTAFTPKSDYCV
jgi:hypothetical protein